jgi:feruloyl-CoA hydratase/lyase
MVYSTIRLERRNSGVATIFFNRPEKHNAMSPTVHKEMRDCLASLAEDEQLRVLVITGAGESFSAGMDLKKYFLEQRSSPVEMDKSRRNSREWINLLRTMSKVTIAAVNGWCVGAALRVIGACDIVFAGDNAKFVASEINFGVFPGGGVTKTLVELLGWRNAVYLTLTGEPIDAKRAAEIGLITKSVARGNLYKEVYALANKLKNHEPFSVRLAKDVLRHVKPLDDDTAWEYEIAKTEELTYLQRNEWTDVALKKFRNNEFKPAFESYKTKKRKTMV